MSESCPLRLMAQHESSGSRSVVHGRPTHGGRLYPRRGIWIRRGGLGRIASSRGSAVLQLQLSAVVRSLSESAVGEVWTRDRHRAHLSFSCCE